MGNLTFINSSGAYVGQRKALIIEPHASGHHSAYLRWIIDTCRERGFSIILGTTNEAIRSSAFKELISDYKDINIMISVKQNYVGSGLFGLLRRELHYRAMFKEFYGKVAVTGAPDVVILPYVDYCTYALAFLGVPFNGTPWLGIAMRPTFHFQAVGVHAPRGRLDAMKKMLFLRLMKSQGLISMLVIDPTLDEALRHRGGDLAERVRYLPDPAEDVPCGSRREVRLALGISDKRVVLLITGALSRRKGVGQLFTMLAEDHVPEELDVIFGGVQDTDVTNALEHFLIMRPEWRERIHVVNHFLSPEEMCSVYAASDIVWLLYEGHYTMSGIITTAGRSGLPVIATNVGLIGWMTAKGSTGIIVNPWSPVAILDAVSSLVRDVNLRVKLGKNGQNVFSKHTIEHAKNILSDILKNIFS